MEGTRAATWLSRSFLLLGLPFGLATMILTPPLQVPDETMHFFRTYQISLGQWVGVQKNRRVGGRLPVGMRGGLLSFHNSTFASGKPARWPSELARDLASVPTPAGLTFLKFPVKYSPVAYAPQALGVTVARRLGFDFAQQFYAGRLGGLVFWLWAVWMCLRMTPVLHLGFWILGLLPMSLFLAGSYSADVVTTGLAFLFTAGSFRLALASYARPAGPQIALLAVLGCLLGATKTAYAPLVGLAALVPMRTMGSWGRWVGACAVVAGGAALGVGLWALSMVDTLTLPGAIDTGRTWATLASDPHGFAAALGRTLIEWSDDYVFQMVGLLGWLDAPVQLWVVRTFAALLVAAALLRVRDEPPIRPWQRVLAFLTALGVFVLIHAVEWIFWTSSESPLVAGYQGRYLIPTVPALLLALRVGWPVSRPRVAVVALVLLTSMALWSTQATLLARYHHPRLSWALLAGQAQAVVAQLRSSQP